MGIAFRLLLRASRTIRSLVRFASSSFHKDQLGVQQGSLQDGCSTLPKMASHEIGGWVIQCRFRADPAKFLYSRLR